MKSNNNQFNTGDILKTDNLIYIVTEVLSGRLRLQIATHDVTDYYYHEHENYTKKAINKWIKDKEMTHYTSKQITEYDVSVGDLFVTPKNNICTVVKTEEELLSFEWYNHTTVAYQTSKCDRRMVNHWIEEGQLSLIKVRQ